jgi:hypothetical protein
MAMMRVKFTELRVQELEEAREFKRRQEERMRPPEPLSDYAKAEIFRELVKTIRLLERNRHRSDRTMKDFIGKALTRRRDRYIGMLHQDRKQVAEALKELGIEVPHQLTGDHPQITHQGIFDMQVCVPASYTDEEILGIAGKGMIRRAGDPALRGDPERAPCQERVGCVHVMIDL